VTFATGGRGLFCLRLAARALLLLFNDAMKEAISVFVLTIALVALSAAGFMPGALLGALMLSRRVA
jgi:hypothetical protein